MLLEGLCRLQNMAMTRCTLCTGNGAIEKKEIDVDDPLLKAKVEYLQDTGGQKTEYELKAFSVSIKNFIKELVQLNPLFKEELGLLMGE
ncbi:MAG: hypothetical protein CM1200mP28_14170 [Deltaproteobacteria bacterium]|nr:MAG: hypothetical protein CM1200mP28_14170 [Deltaproteobacteria bacterium]